VKLFQRLLTAICGVLSGDRPPPDWHCHRVWLVDGSSYLQRTFGQSGAQQRGCGFPVAHLLALFDFSTRFLLMICAAPLRTHDMSQVERMHTEMQPGDVRIADRRFCS
jgi:hypothetical protein